MNGPTFETGPGWGFYVKSWLRRYGWIVLMLTAVVTGVLTARRTKIKDQKPVAESSSFSSEYTTINETIRRGDSQTLLARRIITRYLQKHPKVTVTPGQRIFLEDYIHSEIHLGPIGSTVSYLDRDLQIAIEDSKLLTPAELARWNTYARNIRF